MSATVLDFRDLTIPLPAFLIVDTSIWLQALRADVADQSPHHQDASDFVARLEMEAIADRTIVLVTGPVLEECIFKILQFNFVTEAKKKGLKPREWRDVYRNNPGLIGSQFYSEVGQFLALLSGIPVWFVEPEDICKVCIQRPLELALKETMCLYVEKFNLLSQDALNLAIANRLGVRDIAAIDADFHRADGFTIYTCLI